MSLADKLSNAANNRKPDTFCPYQFMYNNLTPENKKALDEAWAKGLSANVILSALRSEGIKSSNEAIRAHRNGVCKCPKK
jgi:hypothetical protein